MVRTNLTILLEDGYQELPQFFRRHGVELVASLPCYTEENVDGQRGEGVFADSIEVIRRLNAVGYGVEPGLTLNLVYNPGGPMLPPAQAGLEEDYRRELRDRFEIEFAHLHTITNIPIGRFKGDLRKQHQLDAYMDLLRQNFNPGTVERLMCRHQISVAWDGALYDCDFNLALRLSAGLRSANIRDADVQELTGRRIVTGDHCYACTAGAGSSCGGALV
jgi:radical SAM/Cys-rich protein